MHKNFLIYLTIASSFFQYFLQILLLNLSLNFISKFIEKKRRKKITESEDTEKQPVNHIFIGYLDGADPFRALVSCSMESIYKFPSIRGTA